MSVSPYGLKFQPVDINGSPYPGALLYCYAAGTTTPQTVYSDAACATPISNPVVADATGTFPANYLSDAEVYKLQLTDAAGNVLRTDDNIGGNSGGSGSVAANSSSATAALMATNSGVGAAVDGKNTGTGYGVVAEAPVATPTKSALRIVPQNTAPSSPLKGDIYVDSTTGQIYEYDGTGWRRYLRADGGTATNLTITGGTATSLEMDGSGATPGANAKASATSPAIIIDAQTNGSNLAAERVVPQTAAPAGTAAIGDRYEDASGRLLTSRSAGAGGAFAFVGSPQNRIRISTASQTQIGLGTSPNLSAIRYDPSPGVASISAKLFGGGGGGGGAAAGTPNHDACGGGAAGGYAEVLILKPAARYDIAIGAPGGAGANTGGNGGTGGDTTMTINGGALVACAKGGIGGLYNSYLASLGGTSQVGGTGDIVGGGQNGQVGTNNASGAGGSSPCGVGGAGQWSAGNVAGNDAQGLAAGGGGAIGTTSGEVGGVGTGGYIDIIEFF